MPNSAVHARLRASVCQEGYRYWSMRPKEIARAGVVFVAHHQHVRQPQRLHGLPEGLGRLPGHARQVIGHLLQLDLAGWVGFAGGQLPGTAWLYSAARSRGRWRRSAWPAAGRPFGPCCSACGQRVVALLPGRRGCPSSRVSSHRRVIRGPGGRWWRRRCRSRGCATTAWPPARRLCHRPAHRTLWFRASVRQQEVWMLKRAAGDQVARQDLLGQVAHHHFRTNQARRSGRLQLQKSGGSSTGRAICRKEERKVCRKA